MQSFKNFLSLVLLVSCTVRCANHHQGTEEDDNFIRDGHCFLKEISKKGNEDISNFNGLIICNIYYFTNLEENLKVNESIENLILLNTFIAEFSIQGKKNVESFFEIGKSGNYNLFFNKIKEIWDQKEMNLKILNHPSIIKDFYEQVEKKAIIEMNSSKIIELPLIKGINNLKLIITIEDGPFAPLISADPSKVPEMIWNNKSIKIFDNSDFEQFFLALLLNEKDNTLKDLLDPFGMSAENIERINKESSVINILSKYFGEEAKGIHSVEKEVSLGNESDGKDKKTNNSEKVPKILSQPNENNEKKVEIEDETSSHFITTETVEDSRRNSLMEIQSSYLSGSDNEDELEIEDNTNNEDDRTSLEEGNRESGDGKVKNSLNESITEEEKKKDIEEESSEDQETEKDKNKKDGKEEDSENKKQSKDKKEGWGIGKSVVLSVVVIGLILLLLVLGFLLYPRAKK